MIPIPNLNKTIQTGTICFEFPSLPLLVGTYYITLSCGEQRRQLVDHIEKAISFRVVASDVFGTGIIPESPSQGIIYTDARIYLKN